MGGGPTRTATGAGTFAHMVAHGAISSRIGNVLLRAVVAAAMAGFAACGYRRSKSDEPFLAPAPLTTTNSLSFAFSFSSIDGPS
jgi:hypothetical protein